MTPWTTAYQAPLTSTVSRNLLKFMSTESGLLSNHLFLCYLILLLSLILPSIGSFSMSQFFASGGQGIRASASVLPVNIQGWFPLRLTDLISFQSKEVLDSHFITKKRRQDVIIKQSKTGEVMKDGSFRWRLRMKNALLPQRGSSVHHKMSMWAKVWEHTQGIHALSIP